MAKRYVISPVIGGGQEEENSFRAAVSDVPRTNSNSVIPNQADGAPRWRFALSIVGTANLAGVSLVTNGFVFPDYPLDGRLDGMEAETRAALVQNAQAYDLDGQGTHLQLTAANQDASSYRQFLQALGSQLDPSFNLNTFDITEPAQ